MMNVWTPLVPVNIENRCMQFVPGSHRQAIVPHEQGKHYPRIREDHIQPVADRTVNIEIHPGDIVIFSNLLFHRGIPNLSNHVR